MVSLFSSKSVRTTCGLALLAAGAFVGVGLGGCTTTEDVGETLQTVEGFCQQLGQAECSAALVDACYQLTPGTDATTLENSTQRCVSAAAETENCNPLNLPYHPENAETALATVQMIYRLPQQIDSTRLATLNGALATVFFKGQADGSSCEVDTDCNGGSGSKCIVHGGKGICGVPVDTQPGMSCAAPGAQCVDVGAMHYYCEASLNCVVAANAGAACTTNSECVSNFCSGKACSSLKENGATCSLATECTNGFCIKASGDEKSGHCGSTEDFNIALSSCDPYR